MTESKAVAPDQLRTPLCRISFPVLFTPRPPMTPKPGVPESEQLFYSVVGLFPKDGPDKADLGPMGAAASAIALARWSDAETRGLVMPFIDGDLPSRDGKPPRPEYAGMWVIRFASKFPPKLLDRAMNPIHVERELYAGCWCYLVASPFTWTVPKLNRCGVSWNFGAVMKIRDDAAFAGREADLSLLADVAQPAEGGVLPTTIVSPEQILAKQTDMPDAPPLPGAPVKRGGTLNPFRR